MEKPNFDQTVNMQQAGQHLASTKRASNGASRGKFGPGPCLILMDSEQVSAVFESSHIRGSSHASDLSTCQDADVTLSLPGLV